jgi:hypothetical protein
MTFLIPPPEFYIANSLQLFYMETRNIMSARSLQYYVISRKWASDLEFYKIETAFFHHLIADHFMGLSASGYIEQLKMTGKKLLCLDIEIMGADKMLTDQLKQIEMMAEDIIGEDAEALSGTQVQLEYLTNSITRQFREIKTSLFTLVGHVVRDNNVLLAS